VAARDHRTSGTGLSQLLRSLRDPDLPFQAIGGYSRAETNELLARAADALEETDANLRRQISELTTTLESLREQLAEDSHKSPSMEQAVGEVMVTAHRAVEAIWREVDEEAKGVLADARAQARTLLEGAERQAKEVDAARAQAEEDLAKTRDDARRLSEDAESKVAALEAEARRVHQVIDEFRYSWWNLISEALKQLELRVPSADATAGATEALHDALRDQLGEARIGHEAEGGDLDPELASHRAENGPSY
jgi:cell division septum initiation protein DivIVA